MMSNEQPAPPRSTNKHSIISLIIGLLTILVFCGGFIIPIPFTSIICVPISSLLGFFALIYGIVSLNHIKKHDQTGHPMAWTGIIIGAFILLCALCMLATVLSIFYFSPGTLHTPPFIEQFQL